MEITNSLALDHHLRIKKPKRNKHIKCSLNDYSPFTISELSTELTYIHGDQVYNKNIRKKTKFTWLLFRSRKSINNNFKQSQGYYQAQNATKCSTHYYALIYVYHKKKNSSFKFKVHYSVQHTFLISDIYFFFSKFHRSAKKHYA